VPPASRPTHSTDLWGQGGEEDHWVSASLQHRPPRHGKARWEVLQRQLARCHHPPATETQVGAQVPTAGTWAVSRIRRGARLGLAATRLVAASLSSRQASRDQCEVAVQASSRVYVSDHWVRVGFRYRCRCRFRVRNFVARNLPAAPSEILSIFPLSLSFFPLSSSFFPFSFSFFPFSLPFSPFSFPFPFPFPLSLPLFLPFLPLPSPFLSLHFSFPRTTHFWCGLGPRVRVGPRGGSCPTNPYARRRRRQMSR